MVSATCPVSDHFYLVSLPVSVYPFALTQPNEWSSEWLLLQAAPEELTEGESFHIRCHGWKNWNVTKVTYYRNGKALKYGYENFEMSIPNATIKDNGSYYCTGWIKKQNHTSDTINIIVKKSELVKGGGAHGRGKGRERPPHPETAEVSSRGQWVHLAESADLWAGAQAVTHAQSWSPYWFAGSSDTGSQCGVSMKTKCKYWEVDM